MGCDRAQINLIIVFIHENIQFGTGPILLNKMGQVPLTWDRSARFKKICRYDQLRRNSCYDELGRNSLVLLHGCTKFTGPRIFSPRSKFRPEFLP